MLIEIQTVLDALEKEREWLVQHCQWNAEHFLVHHAIRVVEGLKEQKENELQSDSYSYYATKGQKFHLTCPFCGHSWWEERPFPPFCPKCSNDITNKATIEWEDKE